MPTVPKTVSVTELRTKTRQVIQQAMASDEPIYIIYNSQMPVFLANTKSVKAVKVFDPEAQRRNLIKFSGHLKGSKAFAEGGVVYQKKIRAEWDGREEKTKKEQEENAEKQKDNQP